MSLKKSNQTILNKYSTDKTKGLLKSSVDVLIKCLVLYFKTHYSVAQDCIVGALSEHPN